MTRCLAPALLLAALLAAAYWLLAGVTVAALWLLALGLAGG